MHTLDFDSLAPDDRLLVSLGKGVWLMDDHRWALLVWEEQKRQSKYELVHADYHWDAVYDFWENPDQEQLLLAANVEGIRTLLVEDTWIGYDSFIAPAVRRGLVDVVHFFCLEDNSNDAGMYEELLKVTGATQVIHPSIESLASAEFNGPIIFDLCLDLFNRSDKWEEGDLWSEHEILRFLESIRHIVVQAEMVTISLSFGYSGTHSDTRALAHLVVPRVLSFRNDA